MHGRAFLDVARTVVSAATEPYWRATVIHTYYALFLVCCDALTRWGIAVSPGQNAHSAVRLRYIYVAEPSLKRLGFALDHWCRKRNDASYNLGVLPDFASDQIAQIAVAEVTAALALLDAIESDPMRRAAAIASFPP